MMRYCQVGCDLDGVLADGFMPPEAEFVIISGRHTDDWDRTLRQVGASRPIYLRPPNFPGDSPHWKAAMIQAMGITRYYEDRPEQAAEIRRVCPACVILLVENGKVIRTLG
jgi:hypothetical protein